MMIMISRPTCWVGCLQCRITAKTVCV